jgi:peptide/nickel transport system permease protein
VILRRLWEHDLAWSFRRSPVTVAAALLTLACVLGAVFSPWIAPQNPFDPAALDLNSAFKPPAWLSGGERSFPLGSDNQGRDILSTILFGARISLLVASLAVVFSMVLGVALGLAAGFAGGKLDAFIMRVVDVQLSFPAILLALLIDGVMRIVLPPEAHTTAAILFVLVLSIGLSDWTQYARPVRASTMVEKNKEYVQAARVTGVRPAAIAFHHVLPNALGPVLVIATIRFALAIITEATLSFLGVGVSPTSPSLGTFINEGNKQLFSGAWWLVIFPGATLVLIALSINLFGDWLRDALNPRLR